MKLVFSVGSDSEKGRGLAGTVFKLLIVSVLALLALNSSDIRRYFRLRGM